MIVRMKDTKLYLKGMALCTKPPLPSNPKSAALLGDNGRKTVMVIAQSITKK